uniref:T9SS type B sorting domain-containing protein n=1 Tax=uncultured Tenacibaculum sp. TaxID=174713 RepID=UPI0026094488|nr:gliding motility-associated C-terminal domain-containing protein [uncultured Tenacibaculum sp.]
MKRKTKSILILLAIFLVCINLSAQVLDAPIVVNNEGKACDITGASSYPLTISFRNAAYNSDNVFIIELSDNTGSFSDPSKVKELNVLVSTGANNYNQAFNISTNFALPEGTFGKSYKVRVRTTSPVTSAESDPFEAYYDMFTEGELSINNGNVFTLCNGETKEVALDTDLVGEYLWYRVNSGAADEHIATTEEPKYTITQAGQYYVIVDYGECGGPRSRYLTVSGLSGADTQIKGPSVVEICGDETHTFEANVTNTSYTYKWYLDGELIISSNNPTYTTPNTGQFGTYRLEIETGTCTTTSNDVVLQQPTTGYTVTNTGALKRIILSGETQELCITHDAGSAADGVSISWYRNNESMGTAANGLCVNAATAGVYYARVRKSTGATCEAVVDSEKFVLLDVVSYNAVIRTATDYEECNSGNTTLSIVGIKAVAEDGNEYDLTTDQIAMLSLDWRKDGVSTGGTSNEYTVNSFSDSGLYTLNVSFDGVEGTSEALDVKLVDIPVVSSPSNSLCAGSFINYTIENYNASYTYQWIKDGTDDVTPANPENLIVTEVGEYVLKYSGFGCDNELEPISVVMFDDSAVTITPSEKVVMEEGSSAVVVAAGGESYEWYLGENTSGTLLSTTEELTVTTLGFYTVLAKVGNCSVERTIEVVEPDDQIIVPNTLTPNGDGKNDTWKISNKYAFQPLVTVMLYNANGKEILKTTEYKNDWPTEDLGNQKVFYYKIIREDKLIKAGTISVLN